MKGTRHQRIRAPGRRDTGWNLGPRNRRYRNTRATSGARYYSLELGRWINRDPKGVMEGVNVLAFCSNNGVGHTDLLGLRLVIDEDELGFTKADIRRAFGLAKACKVPFPPEKGGIFSYIDGHEGTISIEPNTEEELPGRHSSYFSQVDFGKGGTVYFATRTHPRTCRTNLISDNGRGFSFEAAIVHELMHAYRKLKATDADRMYVPGDEEEATAIGNALDDCMERHRSCLCPDQFPAGGRPRECRRECGIDFSWDDE